MSTCCDDVTSTARPRNFRDTQPAALKPGVDSEPALRATSFLVQNCHRRAGQRADVRIEKVTEVREDSCGNGALFASVE